MKVYFNDDIISKKEVKISPDDRGFLFADGVYEVIRCYHGKLFKAGDHFNRLDRSLRELRIKGPEMDQLRDIAEMLVTVNNLSTSDATVYIQITRGEAPRKHSFPDPKTSPTIYVSASPFHLAEENGKKGVKIILVPDIRWSRCDIKSLALLPNILANQQAKECGAEEAVFVRSGTITEGTHTNFCAMFDGELVTYPLSNYILGGITRKVVLGLCRELNIPYREFPIFEGDLNKADELMIVGTTTDVTPVVTVNDRKVGDEKPGPITQRLQKAFREMVYDHKSC